jgi:hypothetical protein
MQHARIEPSSQGHRGDRNARLPAGANRFGLKICAVGSSATAAGLDQLSLSIHVHAYLLRLAHFSINPGVLKDDFASRLHCKAEDQPINHQAQISELCRRLFTSFSFARHPTLRTSYSFEGDLAGGNNNL